MQAAGATADIELAYTSPMVLNSAGRCSILLINLHHLSFSGVLNEPLHGNCQ